MLSRRVIAYYGLMRASESLPAAYGFAAGAAAPKENGLRWESRGSPIYSAGLCSRAASHTPATRRVRLTVSSSSVLAFTPVSRVRRHIGSFEAAEFTHSQVHRNCYGPRAGLPSFRGRLHSSLRRRGRPQSASNMTTWINSQFPRPDFHRQVQRHYGLQDTDFTPTHHLDDAVTDVIALDQYEDEQEKNHASKCKCEMKWAEHALQLRDRGVLGHNPDWSGVVGFGGTERSFYA